MKFGRRKLIELLEIEIQRVEETYQAAVQAAEQKAHDERFEYVHKTKDAWQTFADQIYLAVGAGQPITKDIIPPAIRSGLGGVSFYDELRRRTVAKPDILQELNALLDVLRASDDDTVSLYSLQKSGFPLGRIVTTSRVLNR